MRIIDRDKHNKLAGLALIGAVLSSAAWAQGPSNVSQAAAGPSFVPQTVPIKGGSFYMGCGSDPVCEADEQPQHRVSIDDFEIGVHEVTFKQWDACVDDGGCSHSPEDNGWGRGNRPVINVSWQDAQEYLRWLNRKSGKNYRLPTEAEWEYAARAGSTTQYSFGDLISTSQANLQGEQTRPVKSYAANAWGLYDMHGNVWEVLQDCWHENYNGAPDDGSAWTSGDCSLRVVRSGGWNDDPDKLRSANRYGDGDDVRDALTGFRVALGGKSGAYAQAPVNAVEPEMVYIPQGQFEMGCQGGSECEEDERPVHQVRVPAFEIARYEVTFDEWDACIADGGCVHRPDDQGWGRGRQPVVDVSWNDAQEYIAWLNRKTGKNYRLPSEAEWEYAARAGTATSYSVGNQISTSQAAFQGDSPQPVGSYAPNPWGLYDMHGNVWEVLEDCWHADYQGAPSDGSAWLSGDCSQRVVRSGAWNDDPDKLRSANRYGDGDNVRDGLTGLRLARSLGGAKRSVAAIEPELVYIPGGVFDMGCSDGAECEDDELPVHKVRVADFEMGRYEVTFDEWDACVADGGCNHRADDRGWGRGRQPVVDVSWNDAQQYIAWLNSKTGKNYRLPTEAEWEYAARAGSSGKYSFGNDISTSRANYQGASPRPVGSFVPNPWGLYDMHGNVWEVLQDCWHDNYQGAPKDGSAWTGDGDCSKRVVRSGGWNDDPDKLRSANRYGDGDDVRDGLTGLRLVRELR